MGKGRSSASKTSRQDPLVVQLREDEKGSGKLSAPGRRAGKQKEAKDGSDGYPYAGALDPKTSKRILDIAKQQQDEEFADEDEDEAMEDGLDARLAARQRANGLSMSDDESDEDLGSDGSVGGDVYEELEIDEGDQAILDSFANPTGGGTRNLADLIMAKISAHEASDQPSAISANPEPPTRHRGDPPILDPKVIEVYTKVGVLLSRYKSGPLPKAFKILPSLPHYSHLMDLTQPENWSQHATLAATKIFGSNLTPKGSQKFFREVLYERFRDEIGETGKLSVQLYQALKKGLYKPAAFFKGILFPLCESGTCTLREAAILGSVISKVSIPVLHSSAALLKLSNFPYTGPTSLFLRVLIDKKYALPYKVVDGLVFHFLRFKNDDGQGGKREMPVLWHQSFLAFVQRYKSDLTAEQKSALLEVLRVKVHPGITPEIRREIANSVARGEETTHEDVEML